LPVSISRKSILIWVYTCFSQTIYAELLLVALFTQVISVSTQARNKEHYFNNGISIEGITHGAVVPRNRQSGMPLRNVRYLRNFSWRNIPLMSLVRIFLRVLYVFRCELYNNRYIVYMLINYFEIVLTNFRLAIRYLSLNSIPILTKKGN